MDTFNDREQLEAFLKFQNNRVRNNVEIVEASDKAYPYMLRMDLGIPKKFIPMMPRRANENEDNTIGRVCVSDTLFGAIIAHADIVGDFFDPSIATPIYTVTRMEYRVCLKPNNKLVYDAERTGEHWLVAYSPKTREYPPVKIGRFFATDLVYANVYSSWLKRIRTQLRELVLFLEITEPLPFSPQRMLKEGHYRLAFKPDEATMVNDLDYRDDSCVKIASISKSDFMKKKDEVFGTLVKESSAERPGFTTW